MEVKYPLLTIDPGINIGLALFYNDCNWPVWTKCIQATQSKGWDLNRKIVLMGFEYELKKLGLVANVVIEKPQFLEQGKGLTAARNESLYKLIFMHSCIVYILEKLNFKVHEIPVNWKGQMDKIKLAARVKKRLDKVYPDHVADAVGMGLFVKGIF